MSFLIWAHPGLVHRVLVEYISAVNNNPVHQCMVAGDPCTNAGFQSEFDGANLIFDHLDGSLSLPI